MKTKTKSTVARRRVKRRQDRVSHKKLRTLRSRKYARKTARKVTRGGGNNNITAYVLYDKIPIVKRTKDKEGNQKTDSTTINLPICVILIKPKTPKDDIYLFFNSEMTTEDVILTVKLLLGIPEETTFTPPIEIIRTTPPNPCLISQFYMEERGAIDKCQKRGYGGPGLGDTYYTFDIPDDLLRISLGTNYVKLSGGIMSYSIESGQFMNMNVNLDTLKGTSHAIQTTDTGYKSLNGQKIKEFLSDKKNGFMKKVLDSGGVLANLYKAYFTSLTDKPVTDQEVEKEFGEDLEGKDKSGQDIKDWKGNVVEPWSSNAKPYVDFKTEMKIKIKESLDDKNNHRMFGLDSETVQTLETRPLEITNAIPVQSGRLLDIFSEIDTNDTLKILFTNLSKNWWTAEELVPFNRTKIEVYDEKRERLDSCYKKEYLRSCGGD